MKLSNGTNDRRTTYGDRIPHREGERTAHARFAEKRAEFLSRELRKLSAEELKALLSTLKEDNRTFEQK